MGLALTFPTRRSDARFLSRNGRRTAVGIGVSLLVHALLLLTVLNKPPLIDSGPVLPEQSPITLLLPPVSAPQAPQVTTAQLQKIPTPPAQQRKPPAVKPKPRIAKPAPAPREMVAKVDPRPAPVRTQPTPPAPPESVQTPTPPTPSATSEASKPDAAPETDMSSMIAAARERRRAAAGLPAAEGESAGNEIAKANIQHSMRTQSRGRTGASGIFQILDKGVRTAHFSFHGWTPGATRQISQLYEVDAGLQGDIDRAIVRKMIALIRSHYPGDFNWESQRLGRVVVLSARPGDNAALESFLLREFFNKNS